jgi:hypothetical protein
MILLNFKYCHKGGLSNELSPGLKATGDLVKILSFIQKQAKP